MKPNWKDEILNSLQTAAAMKAGQTIQTLRDVADANGSAYEQSQVSSFVSSVARYNGRVWVLKRL